MAAPPFRDGPEPAIGPTAERLLVILGLLSDAHGNREAFDQGLSVLRGEGAQAVYFLGDAVGYLPGDGVVAAIREEGIAPILGNHEAMLLAGQPDPQREPIFRLGETAAAMSATNRAFLQEWPDRLELDAEFGPVLLVHGSPRRPLDDYVYPDTDLEPFEVPGARAVFMGQTHRPFVRHRGETVFMNVGSCGLPRDCGHLGSAGLFDDVTGAARIVRFDIREATAAALRRCGPVAPEVLAVFDRREEGGCLGE
jgi:predicted phosphodiesterase